MSNGFSAADMSTAAASAHNTGYQAGYADAVKAFDAAQPAAAQEAVAYWLAVDEDGAVAFGVRADNEDDGETARQEVAEFIDGRSEPGTVRHGLVGAYAAPVAAAPGIDLPVMPMTTSREPDDSMPDGYFESNLDWARRIENVDALEWFIENHAAIRRLIDASPKGGSEAVCVKPNCQPPSWMFPEDEAAPAASVTDWRVKAAAWLEEQAVEQENTNKAYPAHVAAYPSWADRVHWLRTLASKVSESQATSAEVGE